MITGERPAAWVARLAILAFACAALWEIDAPLSGGHWASMAACGIAAENMLRFHLFAPVTHYTTHATPELSEYVCRHPYGIYLLEAVSRALFGHHAWTLRVPAVACSIATPVVLYRLARELWGVVPAAVATVAFVVVPIDLAFLTFSSLEVPTILFGLVFSLGSVRAWTRGHPYDLALSAVGALGACHSDWIGAVLVGVVVAGTLVRGWLGDGWRLAGDARALRRWVWWSAAVAIGTIAFYAALAVRAGQLSDVLLAARHRYGRHDLAWGVLFGASRLLRLEWMVPALALGAIVVAVPVAIARLQRRPGELILLAWVVMASVQYFTFKEGADIHIFWPHYYGPCAALAFGTLTSALGERPESALSGWRRRVAFVAFIVIPVALVARIGVPALSQSRLTQGRFDERGLYIESGSDATAFAAWATRDLPASSVVRCTTLCGWQVEYATRLAEEPGPLDLSPRLPDDRDRIELVDARHTSAADLRALARTFDVTAVGPFLRVDRAAAPVGIHAQRFVERQPVGMERVFVTDHDLVRSVAPDRDAWASWDWAEALGHGDMAPPEEEPTTIEEVRVAHNVALAGGDTSRARALRERVIARMGARPPVSFTDDVRLLAVGVDEGPATVVTLLWEAGSAFVPPAEETTFAVRCRVTERPLLWLAPVQRLEKDMAPPMTLKPTLWRPGCLYTQTFVAMHGFGTETCRGYFAPTTLRPTTGTFDVALFTLP